MMKVYWMGLVLGLAALGLTARGGAETEALRVMAFNIRYNNPDDGVHAWPNRTDRVASVIRFHGADVVGVQEALLGQIRDLEQRLPGFDWVGQGRGAGEMEGEFSPIFYRTDRLELLDHGTFWLSETPERPGSRGWDAALPRIVTWARFRDRATGTAFVHANTHFDHRGEQARRESATLLVDRLDAIAGEAPAVVTGDFNATPDSEVYATLSAALTDAASAAGITHGPAGTYTGFEVTDEPGRRIDYIFVTEGVTVTRHGVLTDQWRGRYPSDHRPVLAEVTLP
jgi:endonuclease/exonuclease/phosphatase family metal-dependent hydrolase